MGSRGTTDPSPMPRREPGRRLVSGSIKLGVGDRPSVFGHERAGVGKLDCGPTAISVSIGVVAYSSMKVFLPGHHLLEDLAGRYGGVARCEVPGAQDLVAASVSPTKADRSVSSSVAPGCATTTALTSRPSSRCSTPNSDLRTSGCSSSRSGFRPIEVLARE